MKEIAQGIVMAIGLTLLIFFVAAADSLPLWFLLIVGIIFWAIWIALIIRDRRGGVQLKIMIDGEWRPVKDLTPDETARYLYRDSSLMQLREEEEQL